MHAVVILGDMNASLIPRMGNLHNSLLMDFVERNTLSWRQNGEETFFFFFHPNKADKAAEIDYVFFNKNGNKLVQSLTIERHTSLNTSDHLPVCAQVNAETNEKVRAETTVIQVKPKWDKCDKTLYKSLIKHNLLKFDSFLLSTSSEIDNLRPLAHFNAVLKQITMKVSRTTNPV